MRKTLVVDVETIGTIKPDGKVDLTPYNPANGIVSVGWAWVTPNGVQPTCYAVLNHKDKSERGSPNTFKEFKSAVQEAEIIVAHNAKFDVSWVNAIGVNTDHVDLHDTMIIEYVLNRGIKRDLTLKHLCEKYEISLKEDTEVKAWLASGKTMYDYDYDKLIIYGRGDVQSCGELYLQQATRVKEGHNLTLVKTIQMSNEFCKLLVEIEGAGICIDPVALKEVEEEFTKEHSEISEWLRVKAKGLMGDTVINFDSPQQLSEVLYSRRVLSNKKEDWVKAFNIGTDSRGKFLKRPRMNAKEFRHVVIEFTEPVYKTTSARCETCTGKGYIIKTRKDGTSFKKPNKCKACDTQGVIYSKTEEVAGLKLQPLDEYFPTIDGFSTSKKQIEKLFDQVKEAENKEAEEFLTKCERLSALGSYLSTFVGGVKSSVLSDNLLHPNFNQCITATGRLSSTNPNLQNQPRGNTFPFKRVFVSRWAKEGGELCSTDFSQLEFRVAVSLAKDPRGKEDILNGLDIHSQTAKILNEAGQKVDRQGAKPHTFKPLYGGKTGSQAEQVYYRAFLETLYPEIGKWHKILQEEALVTKMVTLPTGRQYLFPDVARRWDGGSTHATMIVNYPVQGFATGDIVLIAILRMAKEYKKQGLKSKIVLTVHDDVITDIYPGEREQVLDINKKLAYYAEQELKDRYGYEMFVPLACETKIGPNLLELKVI